MPKKEVLSHVYEIEAPSGMIRVGIALTDPTSVAIQQNGSTVLLDLHAWAALHGLKELVTPRRKRTPSQKKAESDS